MSRLLRFVRPYLAPLLLSVVLMAAVGAAQGFMALLIGPIFDRVLQPETPDSLVPLFTIPFFNHKVYLQQFVPSSIHNVWTMVAIAILGVFLVKGLCDYFGNYFVNYVGLSAVTDLRQKVFDRVLRQDAHFFESNSTGRVMSSIMNDLEKIQVATSHMLADWLRQSFSVIFLLCVVLQKDWEAGHREPHRVALRAGSHAAHRSPDSPHDQTRSGRRRRAQPDPAGDYQRAPGGKVIRH